MAGAAGPDKPFYYRAHVMPVREGGEGIWPKNWGYGRGRYGTS